MNLKYIKERFGNVFEKAKGMTRKELTNWKYTLFFLICVDIFGLYWFLHQKKLGIVLMVVFFIVLAVIMFLESKLPEEPKKEIPKEQKTQINTKKEVKKMETEEKASKIAEEEVSESVEEQEDMFGDFGELGLPNSEDYNKRMNDAFEFKGL